MSNLDMSLDDIIKMNKKSAGGGAGDKRGGANPSGRARPARNLGTGPARRLPNRSANRPTPYSSGIGQVQAPETTWKHDMFMEHAAAYPVARGGGGGQVSSIETGTKLLISNLDYGVSDDDIKELFSEVGDLKRFSVHYDRSGRSKGTAEVVFSRRRDAEAAVKRYHNVQLDGKPMKIEIVGTNVATRTAAPPPTNTGFGNQNGAHISRRRGGAFGRLRGGGGVSGGRGSGGRGSGGNRTRGGKGGGHGDKKVVSAEDLDADLEKYHSEAMQTN